jgi:hypothetical protein
MEIFAGLSVLLLVVVALAIAVKTFVLWFRTRGLPELLLGLYLTCATVTGYPLAIAMTRVTASENPLVHVAAELIMSTGWVCLLLFTLKVFRPDVLWARVLVGLALTVVVVTGGMYILEATGENPRAPQEMIGFILGNSLPVAFAYFWTTFESFHYHRRLKLRLRLGLTDVVLVNRFLLWGLMTLAAGAALVINMATLVLTGSYMSPLVVLVSSALGVAHACCLFLAFHPPGWYRGWLEQGGAPAEGA